jgi:hypothetical protein
MGSISFALYLVHEPLIFYIACIIKGQANWDDKGYSTPELVGHTVRGVHGGVLPVHLCQCH